MKLKDKVAEGPYADINIFSLFSEVPIEKCSELAIRINTTCLFIKDSGNENILA